MTEGKFELYGAPFGPGDAVSCFVDLTSESPSLSFSLNGVALGEVGAHELPCVCVALGEVGRTMCTTSCGLQTGLIVREVRGYGGYHLFICSTAFGMTSLWCQTEIWHSRIGRVSLDLISLYSLASHLFPLFFSRNFFSRDVLKTLSSSHT